MELYFPSGSVLLQDLGYTSYKPRQVEVILPIKKKKHQELSGQEKNFNRLLAKVRVSVEHVMAGVKRLAIVKEKIRLRTEGIRDTVMLIACSLHNLRNTYRKLS